MSATVRVLTDTEPADYYQIPIVPGNAGVLDPHRIDHFVMTPGVVAELGERAALAAALLLRRHFDGDWGDEHPEDAGMNDAAVRDGDRTLGIYTYEGVTIWVIVDGTADGTPTGRRYAVTLLTPDEY